MIDRDGDGRITYEEFLASAKEARVDEQRIATRSMEVVEVLTRISEYMKREVRWAGGAGREGGGVHEARGAVGRGREESGSGSSPACGWCRFDAGGPWA